MKINDAFIKGRKKLQNISFIDNPALESEMMLCNLLKINRIKFIQTKDIDVISLIDYIRFMRLIAGRSRGINIFCILKNKHFYDLDFIVNKHVLIPRPETELIIDILKNKISNEKFYNILDIGAGSGCISITAAKLFNNIIIDAIDISKKAIKTAKKNAEKHHLSRNKINLINKDLFKYNPEKKYDIIISNPPYIKKKEAVLLKKAKTVTDPLTALNGGKDGLKFYIEIRNFGIKYLKSGGWLILEHGMDQRKDILNIFKDTGFYAELYEDMAKIDRVIAFHNRG